MMNYFDKNIMNGVFNSNEFKGWLLSRRWFGDKSTLSNLEFEIIINYFENITENILLTIIEIRTSDYSKNYFLPLVLYDIIETILEPVEKTRSNIVKLTEITFSKKLAMTIENEQKVITLNLIEGEFCLLFWRRILFDSQISEKFPSFELELTLY
ncbi:MAG: hypothetical protein ACFFEN_14780, partial [Candidatus Thorarchaeota archaeon]